MDTITYLINIFHKGGLVMYPLLVCSIITGMVAVERFFYYRSAHTDVKEFGKCLFPIVKSGDWQGVTKVCNEGKGIIPDILAQSLCGGICERCTLENMLQVSAANAAAKLKERLNWLDTIVTLAPLLGLLGTVIGMISSFSILDIQAGNPHALTDGIGEALIATAFGLCVAIFALVVHSYYSHRFEHMISSMEHIFGQLLNAVDRRKYHEAK